MLLLVRDLASALHEAGLPLEAARRSPVHRIYRDIRFPKDKRPFHTHISSALYREGDKHQDGVIYVHLDAKQPFAAAGFWEPDKNHLRRWRESIVADPSPLLRIAEQFPLEMEKALQRTPRGYEAYAETSAAPLLRLRNFIVRQDLVQEELGSSAVLASLVRFATAAAPLLRYGWALE